MPKIRCLFAVAVLICSLSVAVRANTYVKVADEWGTIQTAGARPGNNGIRFWNIEGGSTTFGSAGTLRFDTADLVTKLNADFGANSWKIDNITLVLQHSDAAFSLPGDVNVFNFTNSSVALTNAGGLPAGDVAPGDFSGLALSPLIYDDTATVAGQKVRVKNSDSSPLDLGTVTNVATYTFNSNGNTQTGKLDVIGTTGNLVNPAGAFNAGPDYSLSFPTVAGDSSAAFGAAAATGSWSAGAVANLAAQIKGGASALSFILAAAQDTSTVAATYKGDAFPTPTVTNDYNDDGVVDAADYVIWRENLGSTTFALPHRAAANTGPVGPGDYTTWMAAFGNTPALPQFSPRIYIQASALALGGSSSAVPEPASVVLLVVGVVGLLAGCRRCGR